LIGLDSSRLTPGHTFIPAYNLDCCKYELSTNF